MDNMKKVVTSREVPHLWAHQTQTEARNSNGSLFFDGDTIYSYGRHFPIARVLPNEIYLFTTRDYSVTTSQHKGLVRRSIPLTARVFEMDAPEERPAQEDLAAYAERIAVAQRKSVRSRVHSAMHLTDAARLHATATAFAEAFGLDASALPALTTDAATLKAAVAEDAKRKREETARKKAKLEAESAHSIALWLSGASSFFPWGLDDILLRVRDGEVETSHGARFPLDHARKGLTLVRAVMARGEEWHTNGHTCHLGHYKIDRITASGTVYAGCHVVKFAAIERIAPALESEVA